MGNGKRKSITKKEILIKVQGSTGIELPVINKVVEALLDEIQEAVCRKTTVKFISFGVWEPRRHTGAAMRNPHANVAIESGTFIRPWHRCADQFKRRVKEATLENKPE